MKYIKNLLIALLIFLPINNAISQSNYPTQPIRIVIGFPPGLLADSIFRQLAERLTIILGQQVLIENKPGVSGLLAAEVVAKSKPDGYTLLGSPISALASTAQLVKQKNFDVNRDFIGISIVTKLDYVIVVNAKLPITNVEQLITYARLNPGKLNYASPGLGSSLHLATEVLAQKANIKFTHIPYKGGSQLLQDLVAGQVDFTVTALGPVEQQVKAGQLRIIGVTGSKRNQFIPEIRTVAESGLPNFSMTGNHFLAAPANTPKPILEKLNQSVMQIMANKDVQERWNKMGLETGYTSILATKTLLQTETDFYGKLINELNLSASD